MDRRSDIRSQALKDLQEFEVLMIQGHFDYGNGYHGRLYVNPHQLFRHPSTIWRFAQDLIDVLQDDLIHRLEAFNDIGVPNISLAEYKAPENHKAGECPLCKDGVPITRF